jgi:hypothetical protein
LLRCGLEPDTDMNQRVLNTYQHPPKYSITTASAT